MRNAESWSRELTGLSANAYGSPDASLAEGPADRIRILVANGVRLYREGLSEMLGHHKRFKVVGLAADYWSVLERSHELQPDVVFLDISMADVLRLVHEVRSVAPGAAVVATAVAETDREIVACAEAGVAGFVTRDQSLAEVVRVLESVARGESLCSPRTAAVLLRRVTVLSAQREPPGAPDGLTPREREIARLIAQGCSNKEIARALCIELSTVKNHVHHMLGKLGVPSRVEAGARVRAYFSG
jgi:two-component system, NarL family, nitrate/nitrite response regulator NarL